MNIGEFFRKNPKERKAFEKAVRDEIDGEIIAGIKRVAVANANKKID